MRSRQPSARAPLSSLLVMSCAGCSEPWPAEPFTPEASEARTWEERYVLCNDLVDSRMLEGASREQVVELLGEPNGTIKPDRISYLVRKRKVWLMGEVRVLDIRFDQSGQVQKSFIRGT